MIRRITAEFQSVDEAEIAATKIRNTIDGIKEIGVIPKNDNTNDYNPFGHSAFSNVALVGNGAPFDFRFNAILNTHSDDNDDNYIKEIDKKNSVTLKVRCPIEKFKDVSNIFVSHGGLNIKKM